MAAAGQEVGARQRSRPNCQFARGPEAEATLDKTNFEGDVGVIVGRNAIVVCKPGMCEENGYFGGKAAKAKRSKSWTTNNAPSSFGTKDWDCKAHAHCSHWHSPAKADRNGGVLSLLASDPTLHPHLPDRGILPNPTYRLFSIRACFGIAHSILT